MITVIAETITSHLHHQINNHYQWHHHHYNHPEKIKIKIGQGVNLIIIIIIIIIIIVKVLIEKAGVPHVTNNNVKDNHQNILIM